MISGISRHATLLMIALKSVSLCSGTAVAAAPGTLMIVSCRTGFAVRSFVLKGKPGRLTTFDCVRLRLITFTRAHGRLKALTEPRLRDAGAPRRLHRSRDCLVRNP